MRRYLYDVALVVYSVAAVLLWLPLFVPLSRFVQDASQPTPGEVSGYIAWQSAYDWAGRWMLLVGMGLTIVAIAFPVVASTWALIRRRRTHETQSRL